jgi:hypothetical protein
LIVHLYRESIARDLDHRLDDHAALLDAWLTAMERAR